MSAPRQLLKAAWALVPRETRIASPSPGTPGEGRGEGLSTHGALSHKSSPRDQKLLPDAAIVIEGSRILDTGPATQLHRTHPDATVSDLGDAIILPGLINPHTHLELSDCSNQPVSASFADWILSLASRMAPAADFAGAAGRGIAQSLHFGVTTVGDISQRTEVTRPVLASSPLRVVSYGEALGIGARRDRFEERLQQAIDRRYESEHFRTGVSPHAPYTVDLAGFEQCLSLARELALPLTTHLAETADEQEFLLRRTGAFRDVYEKLGLQIDDVETCQASPVEFARRAGLLDYPSLLAHVNYCDDNEVAILAAGQASVVYCPRTHAYFAHPPHRFREMLNAGINVAIGTDSCASSPDLNLVEELRLVHRLDPDMPAEHLFHLITRNAARALQMDHSIGLLASGYLADLTVFPIRTNEPLAEILETDVLPAQIWIDGQREA